MRVLAVCHDAGGAELICAWLSGRRVLAAYVLGGPARAIFARTLGVAGEGALPRLTGFDLVLCGSSGPGADLERHAVRAARAAGVRCAVWLDHWVNYRVRFELGGALVLPDEVWVCDEPARALARRELPGADVRLVGNPYLEAIAREVTALRPEAPAGRLLYAGEPGALPHAAFRGLLAHLGERGPLALRVRRHPSEPADAYDAEITAAPPGVAVELSPQTTLAQDCAWASTVAGHETMALVVALLAGRRAVAVRPVNTAPPRLPFGEIEQLVV